jgi:DNA replication initiation complex subunit (GINS family)
MLTFESIRELERAERESKKLQKIPDNFLTELKDYIERKEKIEAGDAFEFQAVKSTIARLIELRERKIIDGALITARTGLPPENLLSSEAELFWAVVDRLKRFREEFFGKAVQPQHKAVWRVVKSAEFVGPDLKEYRLQQGETVELPEDVADVLLKSGTIEEVK